MALNRARGVQVIDPFLTNVARLYKSKGLIGDQLLPRIPVNLLSGQYPVFDEQFWFANDVDNKGADRAPSKEIDYTWSLDTYLCEEYKLKVSITDLERRQAEGALRLPQTKAQFLAQRMNIAREVRIATLLLPTSAGGGLSRSSTPAVNWDQDTATIEANIKAGALDVYDAIGQPPNTIVIPYKVAYSMAVQEDIRNILAAQITGDGKNFLALGDRVLPSEIHGMKVVIPRGQITTAKEGAANPVSKSEIWGDDVRLLYIDSSAQWGMPSVAYDLVHTNRYTTRWNEIDPDVEYIRELERRDEKVVAPDAGHVLLDVLS